MPRGVRKSAPIQLPDGVKPAKWVPVLVIPSAGHNAKGDGTHLANARRQTGNSRIETEVRLRYSPCCDAHKAKIGVSDLESPAELHALATRLMGHYGHGKLLPQSAHIDWQECTDKIGCHDCLEEGGWTLTERGWEKKKAA